MAGNDDDKNQEDASNISGSSNSGNNVTPGFSSLKDSASRVSTGLKGFPNFGDDDDDFVVPDHIQDIINQVHSSPAQEVSNPPQNPPAQNPIQDQSAGQNVSNLPQEAQNYAPQPPQILPPHMQNEQIQNQDRVVNFENHENQAPQVPIPPPSVVPPSEPPKDPVNMFSGLVGEVPKSDESSNRNQNDVPASPLPSNEQTAPESPSPIQTESDQPVQKEEEFDPLSFSSIPKKTESIFDKSPYDEKKREEASGEKPKDADKPRDVPPIHLEDIEKAGEEPKLKLPAKKTLRPLKKITAVLLIGAVGVSAISGAYYGYQYFDKQAKESSKVLGTAAADLTIQDMIARIAEIVELSDPKEQPSEVATVEDTADLSNNAFFDRAKNGDLVLIYSESKIAVLYRPASGKVIAIGPVDSRAQETPSPTQAPTDEELLESSPTPSPSQSPSSQASSQSAQTRSSVNAGQDETN